MDPDLSHKQWVSKLNSMASPLCDKNRAQKTVINKLPSSAANTAQKKRIKPATPRTSTVSEQTNSFQHAKNIQT